MIAKIDLENQIENLMDRTTPEEFISALATVLYSKAAHLSANWQDERSAGYFNTLAEKIEDTIGGDL